MASLNQTFRRVDVSITRWTAKASIHLLRISLGVVFLWFGALKMIPGLSPAQALAARTIETLTFGIVSPEISVALLAVWECAIGLGLITGLFTRLTILLLLTQMAGTMLPILFFPSETFTRFPYAPTLEGQYIIKNVVLIAGGLVVGATVRGGRVIAHPDECNC
jgi:uncharacterized membrane protein YphA (DoxX/SURF4 family)